METGQEGRGVVRSQGGQGCKDPGREDGGLELGGSPGVWEEWRENVGGRFESGWIGAVGKEVGRGHPTFFLTGRLEMPFALENVKGKF